MTELSPTAKVHRLASSSPARAAPRCTPHRHPGEEGRERSRERRTRERRTRERREGAENREEDERERTGRGREGESRRGGGRAARGDTRERA